MHRQLLRILLSWLCICFLCYTAFTQTSSGIRGHFWLAGYESNYKYAQGASEGPTPLASRLQHKWYIEHLVSAKTNIGIAYTSSLTKMQFDRFAYNYVLYTKDIEYDLNGKTMMVNEINGLNVLQTRAYELFAKRYFNANALRNYGWYVTYKYGRMYLSEQILPGATIQLSDPSKSYINWEAHDYSSNEVHKSKLSYIGIDLGKTYPLFHPRLLFSSSASFNISFNRTKTDNSLNSHLNKIAGRHVARRHMLLWNFGLSYVL